MSFSPTYRHFESVAEQVRQDIIYLRYAMIKDQGTKYQDENMDRLCSVLDNIGVMKSLLDSLYPLNTHTEYNTAYRKLGTINRDVDELFAYLERNEVL